MMMKFCNETTETMSGVSRPQECEKQVELFLFLFFSFFFNFVVLFCNVVVFYVFCVVNYLTPLKMRYYISSYPVNKFKFEWLWELLHDEKYERHTPNFYFFTACNYDMVFKCKLQHAN